MPFLLTALIACTDKSGDSSPTGGTDSGTPVDTGGDAAIQDLSVSSVEGMSSVFVVRWTTPSPATSWVEFGPSTNYGTMTVPGGTPSTDHTVVVVGAPFGAEWHWRASSEIDGTVHSSADQVHDGGTKPAGLQGWSVESVDTALVDHGIRILPYFGETAGILVLNRDGNLAWHHEFPSPEVAIQATMSADGTGLWVLIGDVSRQADIGEIRFLPWDLGEGASVRAEWAHHDFQLLPDGSWAFLAADIREADGEMVAGDAVMVMDADGANARAVWSTWDALEPPDFTGCSPSYYPNYCDWTHANGLWYDAASDTFSVSLHNDDAVAVITSDGTPLYTFGTADYATIRPAASEDAFVHQHGVKLLADGSYAVFDNGRSPPNGHSRALVIALDSTAGTFSRVWEYDPEVYASLLLGDHDVLPNGNHLLSFGSEAVAMELTDDLSVGWEVAFDLGASIAFISQETSSGGVTP